MEYWRDTKLLIWTSKRPRVGSMGVGTERYNLPRLGPHKNAVIPAESTALVYPRHSRRGDWWNRFTTWPTKPKFRGSVNYWNKPLCTAVTVPKMVSCSIRGTIFAKILFFCIWSQLEAMKNCTVLDYITHIFSSVPWQFYRISEHRGAWAESVQTGSKYRRGKMKTDNCDADYLSREVESTPRAHSSRVIFDTTVVIRRARCVNWRRLN